MSAVLRSGKSIGEIDYCQLMNDFLQSHISLAYKEESYILVKNLKEGMSYEFRRDSGEVVKVFIRNIQKPYFSVDQNQFIHRFIFCRK